MVAVVNVSDGSGLWVQSCHGPLSQFWHFGWAMCGLCQVAFGRYSSRDRLGLGHVQEPIYVKTREGRKPLGTSGHPRSDSEFPGLPASHDDPFLMPWPPFPSAPKMPTVLASSFAQQAMSSSPPRLQEASAIDHSNARLD